jgi:hypothetical protein
MGYREQLQRNTDMEASHGKEKKQKNGQPNRKYTQWAIWCESQAIDKPCVTWLTKSSLPQGVHSLNVCVIKQSCHNWCGDRSTPECQKMVVLSGIKTKVELPAHEYLHLLVPSNIADSNKVWTRHSSALRKAMPILMSAPGMFPRI